MLEDLRFTLRSLAGQPAVTVAAVATLAVGIAAITAIFSTVNAALLRPLPYPAAGDIRVLGTAMTDGRPTTGKVAAVELARLMDPALSIDKLAAASARFDATLLGKDGTGVPVKAAVVGEGFFDVFGLPMALGRSFTHEESIGNGPPFIVLSHRLWRDLFDSDETIVGRSIQALEVDGPITVVGVAARDFDVPRGTSLWINLRLDLAGAISGSTPGSQGHSFDGYLRLKSGTKSERLEAELDRVMATLAREFPVIDALRIYTSRTLVEAIVGDLGRMLVIILTASGVLLILACANVTNLLLARGAVRGREIALRLALGASRRRIIRQLLTESLVLCLIAASIGCALAFAGVRLLSRYGISDLPRLDSVPFDGGVFAFVLGATLVATVLVGLAPAFRLAGTDLKAVLNDGGRGATVGRGHHRVLAAMVAIEIALAIVLVAGAGSLVRSFVNQQNVDPGFAAQGRLVADVSVPFARYNGPEKVMAWSQDVETRLRAVPGVSSVASSAFFPLRSGRNVLGVTYLAFAEQLDDPDHPRPAHSVPVSPGFFETMGIHRIGGRSFTGDDRRETMRVTIVNRSFARRYLADRDPLNARFAVGYPTIDPKTMMTIVGVVDDVRYGSLAEVVEPIFYTPQSQTPYWQQSIVIATSLQSPVVLGPAVRSAIAAADPQLPLAMDSAPNIVSSSLTLQRLGMLLMLVVAVAALGLAGIGIYGMIAYTSAQRFGEMATRMALGATPYQVIWLMATRGRNLSIIGAVAGAVGAYVAGRVLSSQLYEVQAADPIVLTSAIAIVLVMTAVAVAVPARRASKVPPARALRLE